MCTLCTWYICKRQSATFCLFVRRSNDISFSRGFCVTACYFFRKESGYEVVNIVADRLCVCTFTVTDKVFSCARLSWLLVSF